MKTYQNTLSVQVNLRPGATEELLLYLQEINPRPKDSKDEDSKAEESKDEDSKVINSQNGEHPDMPFSKVTGLHFARMSVAPPLDEGYSSSLILSTNFDGDLEEHLDDLEAKCETGLKRIFGFWEGFEEKKTGKDADIVKGDNIEEYADAGKDTDVEQGNGTKKEDSVKYFEKSGSIKKFINKHKLYTPAFYEGTVGIRVCMIHKQKELDAALQDTLNKDGDKLAQASNAQIHQHLRDKIQNTPKLLWALTPPPERYKKNNSNRKRLSREAIMDSPWLVPPVLVVLLVALSALISFPYWIIYGAMKLWDTLNLGELVNLGYLGQQLGDIIYSMQSCFVIVLIWGIGLPLAVILAAILVIIFLLRKDEITSSRITDRTFNANSMQLEMEEDRIVQNALTTLNVMKPGKLRMRLIKTVFSAVTLLARWKFNQGYLGGIPSIHFAKWFLIDNGRRLIFFSNYDGSWENYLSDFVDKAAVGLTAVWSNTINFPKTKFLVCKGARYETAFKIFARTSNLSTHVWYSAYADLSSMEINNNYDVHHGLAQKKLEEKELKKWLSKL